MKIKYCFYLMKIKIYLKNIENKIQEFKLIFN